MQNSSQYGHFELFYNLNLYLNPVHKNRRQILKAFKNSNLIVFKFKSWQCNK